MKALATSERWVSNSKKEKCIKKFAEQAKAQSSVVKSELTGKKICFSLVFEKEKTILCLKLIQLIVNHGGKYNTKVSENQYYVKDEADDPEKYGTRYHHFVEVMGENQGTKVLSYADLFAILETSWEELENMDLPKLPEDDRNKGSYVYSTVNVKGTTIGEILASKGVLSKLDNEE